MHLALLGIDEQTLSIARALTNGGGAEMTSADGDAWRIVAYAPPDEPASPLHQAFRECCPQAQPVSCWEDLLDRGQWQAVLVARGDNQDLRTEQLRKFCQFAVPVLFSHPLVDSTLLLYELDMIRRDSEGVLVPYLPGRLHPAVIELASFLAQGEDSPVGKVGMIAFDRHMAKRDPATVLGHFSQDVDLLRALAGELNQLSAVASGAPENPAAYENLAVHLSGGGECGARYHVCPVAHADEERGVLTLIGSRGKAELTMPADGADWTLILPHAENQSTSKPFGGWQPALAACENLQRACAGEAISPDLMDAARAVELAVTIPRSLKRRRTIELHYEDHTEENTFKGIMAAGGCLLLLVAPVLLLFVALLDKAGVPFVGIWPWVLAALFVGFTLLQLLLWASKRK
jgi:myo-inositol 2-dehydrogenase/D-chiro-inositol 1-dehydrogenase